MSKEWNLKGNKDILSVKNPLRHLCQKTIPLINEELKQTVNPDRPTQYLNLSIGDPVIYDNFKTNPKLLEIVEKGVGVVDGYTDFQGALNAREAVAEFYTNLYGNKVKASDVYLTSGGSGSLWASLNVLASRGDNFLFPEAQFPLMVTMAKSLGIEPRVFPLLRDHNWQIDFQALKKLIDDKTKFILLNDPSNPLGITWSKKHKLQIVQFCKQHNLIIVADQIYETMTFKESEPCFAQIRGDVPVFKCSGLTKKWLVPGWRVGWLVLYGGDELNLIRKALRNIMNIILMPITIVTAVLPQILKQQTHTTYLRQKLSLLQQNASILQQQLKDLDYCQVSDSNGALYAVINIKLQLFNFKNTVQFITDFYKQQYVLIFPGDFFQSSAFVRLVICCSAQQIKQFCVRFKRFCERKRALKN